MNLKKFGLTLMAAAMALACFGVSPAQSNEWSQWRQHECYKGIYVKFRQVKNSEVKASDGSGKIKSQYWVHIQNRYKQKVEFSYRLWDQDEYDEFVEKHPNYRDFDSSDYSGYTTHASGWVAPQDHEAMWFYLESNASLIFTMRRLRVHGKKYDNYEDGEPCDK